MATMPTPTPLDVLVSSVDDAQHTLHTFLQQHPVVHQLLREAEVPLRTAFGDGVTLAFTVETDPETPGWTYLVASIQTSMPLERAQTCLDAFDTAWWLAQTPRAEEALVFDLASL